MYCCPYCGFEVTKRASICVCCGSRIEPLELKHNKEFYETVSTKVYGNRYHTDSIIQKEVSKISPHYNAEKAKFWRDKYNSKQRQKAKEISQNIPKCPTCQSTNIKKISDVKRATHGFMFGLYSKTARSQFECMNCGYKW